MSPTCAAGARHAVSPVRERESVTMYREMGMPFWLEQAQAELLALE